jgi:hypothetical protein
MIGSTGLATFAESEQAAVVGGHDGRNAKHALAVVSALKDAGRCRDG